MRVRGYSVEFDGLGYDRAMKKVNLYHYCSSGDIFRPRMCPIRREVVKEDHIIQVMEEGVLYWAWRHEAQEKALAGNEPAATRS